MSKKIQPKPAPYCDPDISKSPQYKMSPTEIESRKKYSDMQSKIKALENSLPLLSSEYEKSKKEHDKQSSIEYEKESKYDAFRAGTGLFVGFGSVFAIGSCILTIENPVGFLFLILIVAVGIYNIVVAIPRSNFHIERDKCREKNSIMLAAKKKLDEATSEKKSLMSSCSNLKNEFSIWAKKRNEYINIFSGEPFYKFLGFPFEPLLNEDFMAVGTDEEPTKFIVYTKWKPYHRSPSNYRYHKSQRCVHEYKYDPPTAYPVSQIQNLRMLPCQTCTRSSDYPDWIFTVNSKYRQEIEILKKYDVFVKLNDHKHTEVSFFPDVAPPIYTPYEPIPPASSPAPIDVVPSTTTSEKDQSKYIEELQAEITRLSSSNSSLNLENQRLQSRFDAISKDRSSMIDRHRKELEQLQSQLDSKPPASPPNYTDNLFQYALRTLESKGDQLFYSSPSVIDFYRQVTDKRFHRSQVEDISFDGKITVKANINSSGTKYETSLTECKCVDFQRTKKPCKHMLFLAYHAGVLFIHKDELEKNMKIYLDELRSTKPKK